MSAQNENKPEPGHSGQIILDSYQLWTKTEIGLECMHRPVTDTKYLENRLWLAYMAGANAALNLNPAFYQVNLN